MKKWEYMVVRLLGNASEDEVELDSCGINGWELVSVVSFTDNGNAFTAYFKREVP